MSLNDIKSRTETSERSFFDTIDTSGPFWRLTDASDFSDYPKQSEDEFHIRSNKSFRSWESCIISLHTNFLVYRKKRKSKTVEYINLEEHIYKVRLIPAYDPRHSTKYKNCFSIYGNGQSFEFYCKEKAQLTKWLAYFRKYCAMSDFNENYEILEGLGTGGYGEVRLLQSKNMKQSRAGKFIKIVDARIKEAKAEKQKIMVLNEIKILRKLEHTNIVKIYEVYELNDEICIVMEYIEGFRLLDYIYQEKKLEDKDAASLMKQLFLVLNYMESMDIIHRDIKLENIMLIQDKNEKMCIKLIDFGLSTLHHGKGLTRRCGTPGYVAPEVLNNEPYDFKADLYSAGIVLYMCLTGKPPFTGENYKALLEKNKKGFIAFKDKVWSQVSPKAQNLIKGMLEPLPADRSSLEDILNHEWLKENLSLEDLKQLDEYRFHAVKLGIPEEKKISNVPTGTGHFSKATIIPTDGGNRPSNTNTNTSYSMMMSRIIGGHETNLRMNSFYKGTGTPSKDFSGSEENFLEPSFQQKERSVHTQNQVSLLAISSRNESFNLRTRSIEKQGIIDCSIKLKPIINSIEDEIQIPDDNEKTCEENYKMLQPLSPFPKKAEEAVIIFSTNSQLCFKCC